MDTRAEEKLQELQRAFVAEVLTLAEIGLMPEQFRQFKKQVFKVFHERLKPETARLLEVIKQEETARNELRSKYEHG